MSELEPTNEDVTTIRFRRPISLAETDTLFRYLVLSASDSSSPINFEVYTERRMTYGEGPAARYESVGQVPVREGTSELSGSASIRGSIESASFRFTPDYNGLGNSVFTGLAFEVTPGHAPGELASDALEVMKRLRTGIETYFSEVDTV